MKPLKVVGMSDVHYYRLGHGAIVSSKVGGREMNVPLLTQREFYTPYGISLLFDKVEKPCQMYLTSCLQLVAERYRGITLLALRDELRHFVNGCDEDEKGEYPIEANLDILAAKGIPIDFPSEVRGSLDIDTIIYLFAKGDWSDQYGGSKWEEIAKSCKKLIEKLPVTVFNLKEVVSAIDRLNDLEHNNDFYLAEYCQFELGRALDYKAESKSCREIFAESSSDVRKLAHEYRGLLK